MENICSMKLDSLEDVKSLDDYKGKNIVLYVYPKDNTSGCTTEAIEFNKLKEEFEKENTLILGLSRDSVKSHQGFREKHDLGFNLLSDPEEEMLEKLGVLKEVKGRKNLKVVRSTFIFDKEGQLVKEFRNVKAAGHAEEVLDFVKENLN
ncbi:MAG: peroxiredoxin [Anaerococcus sp.]|nr:peroxiredoxin [Peptoniphilaceae bacterium]MDY3054929.1 peroxiredoxin [Anaerococcus sp.]